MQRQTHIHSRLHSAGRVSQCSKNHAARCRAATLQPIYREQRPALSLGGVCGEGLWRSTRPPFHQHNSEGCEERQEQHQLVGHDEAPPRRAGLPAGRVFTGASLPTPRRTTSKPAASTGRQAVGFCVGHPTGDAHEKAPPESVAKFVWEELAA